MKRTSLFSLIMLALLAALAFPASVAADAFPDVILLPTGWQAEGIAVGRGHTFYSGSLATGAIYRGDLLTGEGSVLVPPQGGPSVGMKVDERSNDLFVAGGPTGRASVYDAETGATLAVYQLSSTGNFINDVIVTREAAYFTNSSAPVFYRVPLGPAGSLPDAFEVQIIPLSGDYPQVSTGFGANGITATPNGEWLIIVHSTEGKLYRVDPLTGVAEEIDLGGASVSAGDGILLRGHTLYVVRNRLNQIAVIELNADYSAGEGVDTLTNANFAVPTTIAVFGNALYAVNARFGYPDPANQPFEVVRVPIK